MGCNGRDIYTVESDSYLSNAELEKKLNENLVGLVLAGLPIRTRSKAVKSEICRSLGYEVPKSFRKTRPRFPAQNFDTYIQKSLNLQIWNDEIGPQRRYVLIGVNDEDIVYRVRVIGGDELIKFDTTGTLTSKFQARMPSESKSMLFSNRDTKNVIEWCELRIDELPEPTDKPASGMLVPVAEIYDRLSKLIDNDIDAMDAVQERNRGAGLHRAICMALGYSNYKDNGQYPDIPNQLIEIKLQTSPTIDLGTHNPGRENNVISSEEKQFTEKDIRYVIFGATKIESCVHLERLFVVTGEEFTEHFPLFGGRVINSKLQLRLPDDFFD